MCSPIFSCKYVLAFWLGPMQLRAPAVAFWAAPLLRVPLLVRARIFEAEISCLRWRIPGVGRGRSIWGDAVERYAPNIARSSISTESIVTIPMLRISAGEMQASLHRLSLGQTIVTV